MGDFGDSQAFDILNDSGDVATLANFFRGYTGRFSAAWVAAANKGMQADTLQKIKDATPFGRPGQPGIRDYYDAPKLGRLLGLQVRENWQIIVAGSDPGEATSFVLGGLSTTHPGGVALIAGTGKASWIIKPRYKNGPYGKRSRGLRLTDNKGNELLPEETGLRKQDVGRFSNVASRAAGYRSPKARARAASRSAQLAEARSAFAANQPNGGRKYPTFVRREQQQPDKQFSSLVAEIFARASNDMAQAAFQQLAGAQGSDGKTTLSFLITDGKAFTQ